MKKKNEVFGKFILFDNVCPSGEDQVQQPVNKRRNTKADSQFTLAKFFLKLNLSTTLSNNQTTS